MKDHSNYRFTRRDFLNLATAFPISIYLNKRFEDIKNLSNSNSKPNFIIILCDTLSAKNLSLYGYQRDTSPNLSRFAKRATVYHAHRTAGNYTTPSTASLFTSSYPWTHRAFSLSGLIHSSVVHHNIFEQLASDYQQIVYTQNVYADMLLYQFNQYFQQHLNIDSFSLAGKTYYDKLFPHDAIFGLKSYDQFLFIREEAHGSLFLSILNDVVERINYLQKARKLSDIHPGELPRLSNTDIYFLLGDVFNGVQDLLEESATPYFKYIHLMPPHEPYVPTREFIGLFDDGWSPEEIKPHRLAPNIPQKRLNERRQSYDEFIANLDDEFGKLLDFLDTSGLMESAYIIFTSDHGELFERGVHGHSTPLMFEPVINVPLLISAPDQSERYDIYANTSNVDILPTLIHLAGKSIPEWCEGTVLPGLGGMMNAERDIFVVEAKKNPANLPLRKATTVLIKDNFKLIHYFGYKHYNDEYELYDLKNDPNEINDIFPSYPYSLDLKSILTSQEKLSDQPFLKNSN